jgi:hypothetical protein
MGLAHSPAVIVDGLVLYLDASNSRSYSGSGLTVNGLVSGIGGSLINGVGFTSSNSGSFVFDGTNDGMYFSTYNFSTGDFTMEVWLKLNAYPPTANSAIIANRNGTTDDGWLFDINSNQKARLVFQNNAGTVYTIETLDIINLNQWTNLTAIRSNTSLSFYRNSIFQASTSFPSNYNINSPISNDYVGRYQSSSGFLSGNISKIQYYNRALSSTEVLQNYNTTRKRFGL